jgi:hypothetical protein
LSIQDDVRSVKEELSSEEKFFEKVVRLEGVAKKYKKIIVVGLVLISFAVVAVNINNYLVQNKKELANKAFLTLKENPNNKDSLKVLKSNSPAMYELFNFHQAVLNSDVKILKKLSNSQNTVIADLSQYQLASLEENVSSLKEYTLSQDAMLKDMAILSVAYLLTKKGDIKSAHTKLNNISKDSLVYSLAMQLKHYGLVGK